MEGKLESFKKEVKKLFKNKRLIFLSKGKLNFIIWLGQYLYCDIHKCHAYSHRRFYVLSLPFVFSVNRNSFVYDHASTYSMATRK